MPAGQSPPGEVLPSRSPDPLAVNRTSDVAFRFAQYDWKLHLTRLRDLNFRAAIVGPQGPANLRYYGNLLNDSTQIQSHAISFFFRK